MRKKRMTRRSKSQILVDDTFIWEQIQEGKTATQVHKELNELRGYEPPLSKRSINGAFVRLKENHRQHLADDMHQIEKRKQITIDTLLQLASKQFQDSIDRLNKTESSIYDADGKLIKKTVTKAKQQSNTEWFKLMLQAYKLQQEMNGNLKNNSHTLNTNIGIYNVNDSKHNFNIPHKLISKLTDDNFDWCIEQMSKGELIDLSTIKKLIAEQEKNALIVDGEIIE